VCVEVCVAVFVAVYVAVCFAVCVAVVKLEKRIEFIQVLGFQKQKQQNSKQVFQPFWLGRQKIEICCHFGTVQESRQVQLSARG